nr:protease 2 [Quercus suber]
MAMAKKVSQLMEMFGDVRVDNYYWLRDDSRSNPEVLSYLKQENHYNHSIMSDTKKFEDDLYAEIRGRIKEDDVSAPVSPNHKLVAYAEDTKGDEIYTIYVIDAHTGALVDKPLVGVTASLEWATNGDGAFVYITMDQTLRPHKAWLHKLGEEQSSDTCLYHEKDDTFSLDLQASESKKFLFVASETCPLDNTSETTPLLPHRESVKIQDIQLFNNHIVVYECEKGLPKVTIYGLPDVEEPLKSLQGGHTVEFVDPIYSVEPSESQFTSSILRLDYSSVKTPHSVYDYDMKTGISVLKKIKTVLGGFDASNYVTERKWANAQDGTQIPISIVYHKDLVKLDGSDPLLLDGYGSYEKASTAQRKNCAFVEEVLAAVAEVPFVDVLTTMLDPTIPLTTSEWEEWGDPRKEEFYFYIKSYSPVDNVKAQNYPNILVTAGLNDPRVMYSEPAKFVAKLRDLKTDDNLLLFKCEFGAGHDSKSGRFEKLQEESFKYAFIMKALNMIPDLGCGQK